MHGSQGCQTHRVPRLRQDRRQDQSRRQAHIERRDQLNESLFGEEWDYRVIPFMLIRYLLDEEGQLSVPVDPPCARISSEMIAQRGSLIDSKELADVHTPNTGPQRLPETGRDGKDLQRALTRSLKVGRQRIRGVVKSPSIAVVVGRLAGFIRWWLRPRKKSQIAFSKRGVRNHGRPSEWRSPGTRGLKDRSSLVQDPQGFSSLRLIQAGARPRIIERGPEVVERSRRWNRFIRGQDFDPECNLLYGEGGAGAYSDGKLYTRVQDPRVPEVLEALVEHGAPKKLDDGRPHVGSNLCPGRQKNAQLPHRKRSQFRFDHRLVDMVCESNGTGLIGPGFED